MTVSEAWVDFIAGWCSGAMGVLACQPVDTVLTRLQAGRSLLTAATGSSATVASSPSSWSSPSLALQTTRGFVSHFGISALWRGSGAMITAVPMQNALLMGGYGIGKKWSEDAQHGQQNTYLCIFLGGCTGGVIQSFLMSPVELMKVNQQIVGQSAQSAGKELVKGLRSSKHSWRGLNATILRDGIPHGVWFVSYQWAKTTLSSGVLHDTQGEQVTVPLLSGAFAATVAWVSSVIKQGR